MDVYGYKFADNQVCKLFALENETVTCNMLA